MSEHRHNWHIHRSYAVCIELDCNAELTHEEAERRLNATEYLSPEKAVALAYFIYMGEGVMDELIDYAKTLDESVNADYEGEDG